MALLMVSRHMGPGDSPAERAGELALIGPAKKELGGHPRGPDDFVALRPADDPQGSPPRSTPEYIFDVYHWPPGVFLTPFDRFPYNGLPLVYHGVHFPS